jgi:tetratricopeptide (TPR) repeat protein
MAQTEISLRDQYWLAQTMKLDPNHGMAHYRYGKARGNIGILLRAAELMPGFYPLEMELSLQYFLEGSLEVPTQILENIEREHPTRLLPHYLKALFLQSQHRDEEALDSLWEILKKQPRHGGGLALKERLLGTGPVNLTARQLHNRGLWYERMGRPHQAYLYFHWALERNPENFKARAALHRVVKFPRGTSHSY